MSDPDWDLERLTNEELEKLSLHELQRIRNKRWAHGLKELQERAESELKRRDPRNDWQCLRCGKAEYSESQVRVAGSFAESFLGWERTKYHTITCSYCGKTEFYKVLMSVGEERIGFFGS